MMNICKIVDCSNASMGKGYRCDEHAENCLAEGCQTPAVTVRCSKHAARYARLGHSALKCKHAGCIEAPDGDTATCLSHYGSVSPLQADLDTALALLQEHGTVKFWKF